VTAFEVWLFDKNDIRTASQVLVGDAGSDPTLQAAASEKGEPIIASPGETFSLETATLRLRIRVVESTYRQIERQQNSVFQKLTLEAAAWPLETSRDTGGWGWSHLDA
jgi:hypothetical protein